MCRDPHPHTKIRRFLLPQGLYFFLFYHCYVNFAIESPFCKEIFGFGGNLSSLFWIKFRFGAILAEKEKEMGV